MAEGKALTPTQQKVVDLTNQDKTVKQIAKVLKISDNGVYQHQRRIRELTGDDTFGRPAGGTKRGRPSGRKRGRPAASGNGNGGSAPAPKPASVDEEFTVTPLQAVRTRRRTITAALKESEVEVTQAQRALDTSKASHEKLTARYSDELKQLDAAEAALSNGNTRTARRTSRRSSSKGNGSSGNGASAGNGSSAAGKPAPATA